MSRTFRGGPVRPRRWSSRPSSPRRWPARRRSCPTVADAEGSADRLPAAGRGRGGHGPRARLHREPALRRRGQGRHAAAGRRSAAGAAADRPALRGLRPLRRHDRGHLARADLGHLGHPELAAGGRSSASPTTSRPSCRTSPGRGPGTTTSPRSPSSCARATSGRTASPSPPTTWCSSSRTSSRTRS